VTPLHLASFFQHLESVQVLLDHGANVNAKDNVDQTPLHRAYSNPPLCYPGGYDIPELLIKHGVDVNARDEIHETPLHLASRLGLLEGVWILLKHGADLNMENKEGKLPFQLAREMMREEREIMPSEHFNRTRRAECVALMGLLYKY
jgi:ankyrin repeat protein